MDVRLGGRRILAVLIVAVALALRLWNLNFGLPDWYHPDEPRKARIVLRTVSGDPDPGYFYHPSFMLYASALTLRVGHAGGAALDEQTAVRAGRLTVALLGSATVALTYVLGRSMGGAVVGLVAALLLAVAPLHVVCSHYLKEDVPMTFWAVAAMLGAGRIARHGRRGDYLLAGLLGGLAAGTKYTGLLFVGLPWLAHRERRDASGRAPVALALGAAAAAFLVTTPYAPLRPLTFLEGLGHNTGAIFTGMADVAVSPLPYAWTFHLCHSIIPGFGAVATLLAGWGSLLALRRGGAQSRLLTTTVFVLYAVFENSPFKPPPNFDRYVVPMMPFLAVLAAQACLDLSARLAVRLPYPRAIILLLVAVAAAKPLWDTLNLDASMALDTRQAARAWLVREACPGERILLEGSVNTGDGMVPAYSPVLPEHCHATYRYSLARAGTEVEKFDIVVASSFMYERFLHLLPRNDPNRRFYEDFFARHRPVAEFVPSYRSYGFHNPTIRVYRLRHQHR